ncbi:MAG: glycosyltransferase family 2 protein [Xanthomonadales bacterium]|nr:glycosyltransferase family 2 protein [Xanthomonadales bacterium]
MKIFSETGEAFGPLPFAPISVVVPCYRSSKTIRRAINSIAAQTCRLLEVILVDDGSGDDTLDTLLDLQHQYGSDWIKVIPLAVNGGASAARNAGWDAAAGELIAFLDADDAWHPEKIRIQHGFMAAHPEFTLTGHGHGQLDDVPSDYRPVGQVTHDDVSYHSLLLSNRFITPSAMIRRDVPFRFDSKKRHMEDFYLWLTVAVNGHRIAMLKAEMAYIFKAPFGEQGLSGDIVAMEKGELDCYWKLHREGHLGTLQTAALSAYSCTKFIRRIAVSVLLGRRAAMPWLFPLVYLAVTHSTTALLIIVGLLGRPEIATDIALIQGATLATFYALSANTRNLILRRSSPLLATEVLLARLVLLAPLMGVSLLLSLTGTAVPWWLAVCIVIRRGVEWINEVHLCEAELLHKTRFAVSFLLLQCTLLSLAAASLAFEWPSAMPVMMLWAILPLIFSIRFLSSAARATLQSLKRIFGVLTSHVGSTLIIGLRIYAFRILVVLMVVKDVAGDLFTAMAIGSFLGTLFANVFGPSIELHRERAGKTYYPPALKFALATSLLTGFSLLTALRFFPEAFPLMGKSGFFWLSCGLSLIGGAVMVSAQGVRLRLLRASDGRDVFGPDVIIHITILGTVPLAYFLLGVQGLAGLYLIDALLCYFFYKSSEMGLLQDHFTRPSVSSFFPAILSFLLVFPLFFQLSGRIYNSIDPVVDSGGVLANLPLPISIIACFVGILLLARYRHATRSFTFILIFFAVMLLSAALTTSGSLERGKLLLLIQFLLPAFGLILGEMIEGGNTDTLSTEKGFIWACAAIIPLQLLASWAQGQISLTHHLGLFSVYQHWQFVPVVVVTATLISTAALHTTPRYHFLASLLPLASLIYAISAFSMIASALALVGVVSIVVSHYKNRLVMTAIIGIALSSLAGYMYLLRSEPEYSTKFVLPITNERMLSPPCVSSPARYISDAVQPVGSECLIRGEFRHRFGYLITLPLHKVKKSAVLVVEGEIVSGGVTVGVVQAGKWAKQENVNKPGPFKIELSLGEGRFEAVLANYLPETNFNEVRISRIGWSRREFSEIPGNNAELQHRELPDWAYDYLPSNLLERVEDWVLFGAPIFSSPTSFFFGHPPMSRSVRTSAHNYYIDLAYNFGVIALLPIALLFAYTAKLLWLQRKKVKGSKRLLWLAALVAFFLVIDSNFKVTLRQPYPGIFAFFLWGLLLARLRNTGLGPQPDNGSGR